MEYKHLIFGSLNGTRLHFQLKTKTISCNNSFWRISYVTNSANYWSILKGKWPPFFELQHRFCILSISLLLSNHNPLVQRNLRLIGDITVSSSNVRANSQLLKRLCVVAAVDVRVIKRKDAVLSCVPVIYILKSNQSYIFRGARTEFWITRDSRIAIGGRMWTFF